MYVIMYRYVRFPGVWDNLTQTRSRYFKKISRGHRGVGAGGEGVTIGAFGELVVNVVNNFSSSE